MWGDYLTNSIVDPLIAALEFLHHSHGPVAIVEHVSPLNFACSSSSFISFDPFFQEDILLLVCLRQPSPVIPCDWVVEFDAVCYQFKW